MSWTLVYENDPNGAATFGNIQTLINAVRNGSPVNVVLQNKDKPDYLYAFVTHTVHVRDGVVSATNTQDVSSKYVGADVVYQDDSYYYMVIANTTGLMDAIRWSVGEHTPRNHDQTRQWTMRWFVD